jgi:hypothetical protein
MATASETPLKLDQESTPVTTEVDHNSSQCRRPRSRRSWAWLFASQFYGLAWLVPGIALLVLNARRTIFGASIVCTRCGLSPVDDYDTVDNPLLHNLDHDILGLLQVASRVLDIWFAFVAASLVFDLVMLLAWMGVGLPVAYFLMDLEFRQVASFLSMEKWTAAVPSGAGARLRGRDEGATAKLYAFLVFAAMLCGLVNVMGPSTAILILPALRSFGHDLGPARTFERLATADPPRSATIATGCTEPALSKRNYSCTADLYAPVLDSSVESVVASEKQFLLPGGFALLPSVSQEGSLASTFNVTDDGYLWAPSRQVLRELSDTYVNFFQRTDQLSGIQIKPIIQNVLAAELHRMGPTIGLKASCFTGNLSTATVRDGWEVRCYVPTADDGICIRVNAGSADSHSQFFLEDTAPTAGGRVSVNAYSADRYVCFNSTSPPCPTLLPNRQRLASEECNWESIFSPNVSVSSDSPTQGLLGLEYFVPSASWSSPNERVFCGVAARSNFSDYSLELSTVNNLIHLVQNGVTTNSPANDTLVVHPDWILATWSVEPNGTVDGTRGATMELIRSLKDVLFDSASFNKSRHLNLVHDWIAVQMMSMVNYYSNTGSPDASHPILLTHVITHAWAYGLESTTSKLSFIIVAIGCLCVALRTCVGILARTRKRWSHTELLVSALEHRDDSGTLEGLPMRRKARMRYLLVGGEDGVVEFAPKF